MGIRSIARELNLSPGQVSKLAARGMPVDEGAEAAIAWRRKNLDPSWTKSAPAGEDGFEAGFGEMLDDLLRVQLPPRLWRIEHLVIAATEAGIEASAAQLVDMHRMLVFLLVHATDQSLGDEGAYELPACALAVAGTPEHAACLTLVEHVRAEVRARPLRGAD